MKKIILLSILTLIMSTCTVSYKFNGASIDYSKIKTIDIRDFQNQATSVYPPLTQTFNERLKDVFNRNTKLSFTNVNPDLELEGEITQYDLAPLAVAKDDNYASQTRLTMTVRMRFRNNKNPEEDKEETFSAYQDFPSSKLLDDVQDALIEEMTKEIVDQIFNSTMSNW